MTQTKPKTRVDILHVAELLAEIKRINDLPFEDIEWCNNGHPIPLSESLIAEWKFIGLSNKDFVPFLDGEFDEE